jgi:hypothetical protein
MLSGIQCLRGGRDASRTCAEGCVGRGGLDLFRSSPLTMFVRQEPALAMMLSLYVTLGIFLLLAARDPSANRRSSSSDSANAG